MKLLPIYAGMFIAALAATPSYAHRSDTEALEEHSRIQAQLQSNVQSMQNEIAELRNMIERQQFELSKLKSARSSGATAANPYANSEPRFVPGVDGLQPAPSAANSYNPYGASNEASSQGAQTINGSELSVDNSEFVNDGYPSADDQGFNQNSTSTSTSTSEIGGQFPPVEERQIGAGATLNAPANAGFPASGAGSSSAAVVASGIPSSAASGSAGTPGSGAASPILGVPIDAMPGQGGGVIAIPNQANVEGAPVNNNQQASNEPAPTAASESENAIEATLGEAELYQQAFELLRQSKHKEAVEVFTQQVNDFPYGEYADDANYWIAESKYVNRDLSESKKYFKVIMDQYKQSPRLPDAMLKTAYIEQEQGNKIEARILLQEILQFHPRSNAAISAKNRLAELGT